MISLIIPCFNEEESLPLFYPEATSVLRQMNCDYELIFVNDGSRDRTLEILKELSEKDPHVIYLSFSRNFGKEAGLYAGLSMAKGDYVATMDVDLQDPPALLPDMWRLLHDPIEDYDCVATKRTTRKGEPAIRSFFARQFYKIINKLSKTQIVDGVRDFRMMSRQMVNAIVAAGEYNRFSKGIFSWVGFKTKWLSYENIERSAGHTKWSFWKLFQYSVDGILAYTTIPLYLSSVMGIAMCGISFLALIFIFIRAMIAGDPVAGWPSLVCIITLLGGLVLMSLGIIGLYIAKIYLETKKRQLYIVREEE